MTSKIYTTQEEIEAEIVDGVWSPNCNVEIRCDININASINAENINAENINARNINARNINAWKDINAWNINAGNIETFNINALNINAFNISYFAVCIAYESLECVSVKGRRENSVHRCLDSEIVFKEHPTTKIITLDGKDIEISEESFNAFKEQFKEQFKGKDNE